VGLALALAATACGPSAEKLEADRVARSIDVLRNAPAETTTSRLHLVEELETQPATGKLAVSARDACARAYRSLEEASLLEAQVRKGMADPSTMTPAMLQDLVVAGEKVEASKAAMPGCERAVSELRMAFR
jgi:hypothetical protein